MCKYRKVADDIANLIARNVYMPGTKLPSIRESSHFYNVGINTIKEAYRQLEDRGLIFARSQSGYYVYHLLPELDENYKVSEKVSLSGINRILSLILEKQSQNNYIDLALACPVGDLFYPAAKIRRITSHILRIHPKILTTYTLPPGSLLLRTQIVKRGVQLGMLLSVEDIILTHGTMEALGLALRAATKTGDKIAVETPTFYNLYPLIRDLGREIVEIPTNPHDGMCLDTLQELIKAKSVDAVITIPTGHNPLGFSMTVDKRKRLAEMANIYCIPVIEDAMYAELQFEDSLLPNIKSFDTAGWILTCSSYTKTVAPDYRIGWIEAGRFRDVVQQLKFMTTVSESVLLAESLGVFFENGGYDLHLRHLRKQYRYNLDVVRACIAQHFPMGTRVSRPQAGFILWLELPNSIDAVDLFYRALEYNILCMPGILYSGDKSFKHCLRIAACFEPTPAMLNGIARLGQLAKEIQPIPY